MNIALMAELNIPWLDSDDDQCAQTVSADRMKELVT
jgi:hypothetical protein